MWLSALMGVVAGCGSSSAAGTATRASQPRVQALVPADATVQRAWTLPAAGGVPEQVAVTWVRQTHPDDYPEHALVIWERSVPPRTGPPWRRIYLLDDNEPAKNVVGISVHVADVTGDGHLDVLAYQNGDGSGGCGTYDLLATGPGRVRSIYRSLECSDVTVVAVHSHALLIDRGFRYAPHGRHVHPVFRTWRRTVKRWDGHRLETVRRYVIRPPKGSPGSPR